MEDKKVNPVGKTFKAREELQKEKAVKRRIFPQNGSFGRMLNDENKKYEKQDKKSDDEFKKEVQTMQEFRKSMEGANISTLYNLYSKLNNSKDKDDKELKKYIDETFQTSKKRTQLDAYKKSSKPEINEER